jgi:hypothetical protein
MAVDPDARADARMDRMEAMIREIEGQQHAITAGQRAFKWASGIIATFVIAVIAGLVVMDLTRIFSLGDRIADVDKQTGQIATSMDHLEQDVSQMADDLEAVRADVSRVAVAVGAGDASSEGSEKQQKTELLR